MQANQIDKTIKGTRRVILIIMVLCILTALSLSYIFISFFSKRIKAVCAAMDIARTGDFSHRIGTGRNKDEISQIALNFNHMCDNLDDYINRVYVSGMKQKDAELKQKIAELYALQSQVNPHFLYNTLEAIRMSAVASGNENTGKMIRILGAIFRNSIKPEMFVSIRSEIDYCKSYLELFTLRYGENLNFSFDIDDTIYQYGIIKHLLQPLIENSVIHGIDPDKSENLILIKSYKNEDDIEIFIEDNGVGISHDELMVIKSRLDSALAADNGRVGIVNVNQRIKLIYGSRYGVDIDSFIGKGTSIHVKIPVKTVKELEHYVQGYVG